MVDIPLIGTFFFFFLSHILHFAKRFFSSILKHSYHIKYMRKTGRETFKVFKWCRSDDDEDKATIMMMNMIGMNPSGGLY